MCILYDNVHVAMKSENNIMKHNLPRATGTVDYKCNRNSVSLESMKYCMYVWYTNLPEKIFDWNTYAFLNGILS